MELIGLILGLVALAVGLYHVVEIRRALSNLAVVQSSISTQYLGQFPKFMDDIIALVEGANSALIIFCDFPGYGEFSNPPKALEYQQALERKRQGGLKLDVTCLDAKSRRRYLADQFPAASWRDWADNPETRAAVTHFLEAHPDRPEAGAVTYDRLLEMLHEADQKLLDEPYLNTARQIALHMPIYFWIADKQKAIFTIPTLSEHAVEHGFITSDHALIQALLEMHGRYKKESEASPSVSSGHSDDGRAVRRKKKRRRKSKATPEAAAAPVSPRDLPSA